MKNLFIIFILSLGFTVTAFAQTPESKPPLGIEPDEYSISIVRLISTPEKYHNKEIQIKGYLNLDFEGDAIYLHKEDYENGLRKNGFWINLPDNLTKADIMKLNKKYVIIEGTFDMYQNGHMGLWGGEIKNITRIEKIKY